MFGQIIDYDTGEANVPSGKHGAILADGRPLAFIPYSSGGYSYYAEAAPGSLATAAVWRCSRKDSSGVVTWADGNANFDNIPGVGGASLPSLSYS